MKKIPEIPCRFRGFFVTLPTLNVSCVSARAMMTPEITSGIIYANLLPRSAIDLTTPIAVATQ